MATTTTEPLAIPASSSSSSSDSLTTNSSSTKPKDQRLSSSFSDVCMEEFTPPDDDPSFLMKLHESSSLLLPIPGEVVLQCIVRTRYVVFASNNPITNHNTNTTAGSTTTIVEEDSDNGGSSSPVSSSSNSSNPRLSGHRIDHSNAFHHPTNGGGMAGSSLTRGLFRASTQVGNGFLKGASGLVQSTYAGGASGSLFGLAKGLGLGVIGFGSATVKGAVKGVEQVTSTVGDIVLGSSPHYAVDGTLFVTNFRVLWHARTSSELKDDDAGTQVSIPLAEIQSVEYEVTAPHVLSITCKSLLRASLAFENEQVCYGVLAQIHGVYEQQSLLKQRNNRTAADNSAEEGRDGGVRPYVFAPLYAAGKSKDESESSSSLIVAQDEVIYDATSDYTRIGLLSSNTSMQVVDNATWTRFPTYPRTFLLPAGLSSDDIEAVASYRSARRVPAVVWMHRKTNATISRCAQPCVGLSGFCSDGDKKLMELLNTGRKFHFIDARSSIAAAANAAQGKGTEDVRNYPDTELHHCDIGNIHVVRSSYNALSFVCRKTLPSAEELEGTQWLLHVSSILAGCVKCCALLMEGESLMIHCSDGWDRTPQMVALVEILLDSHYRTLRGFLTLIEKEWVSFGHMFRTRYSQGEPPGQQETEEQSPVFIQWLDVVWQVWRQNNWAFEFNETLLSDLYRHVLSCQFGNFLYNSQCEANAAESVAPTLSLWPHLLNQQLRYVNASYDAKQSIHEDGVLLSIEIEPHSLVLWDAHIVSANPVCNTLT